MDDDAAGLIDEVTHRPLWQLETACRGLGTEGFIIKNGGRHNRALCGDCPVRQECLEAALANAELVGLWGGTTDAERREMRRASVA